jgi:hypothetical protein
MGIAPKEREASAEDVRGRYLLMASESYCPSAEQAPACSFTRPLSLPKALSCVGQEDI